MIYILKCLYLCISCKQWKKDVDRHLMQNSASNPIMVSTRSTLQVHTPVSKHNLKPHKTQLRPALTYGSQAWKMTAGRTTAPRIFERENVRKTNGRVRKTLENKNQQGDTGYNARG